MPLKRVIKGIYKPDLARKDRGKSQKIYLIKTHEEDAKKLERVYEVMGTTKNVYTVTIKTSPTCTCPDHMTRLTRCKHIYFVLTRIMKVKSDEEDIKKYSDDDLKSMFTKIPEITNNLKVSASLLNRYQSLQTNDNGEVTQKKIDEEDQCPICLDDLYECDEEVIFCKYSCGNNIHRDCFEMYYQKKKTDITCLYCTKKWNEANKLKYVNLD